MNEQLAFEFEPRPAIKGFPELCWAGKKIYTTTQYYPAQLKEIYGSAASDGWLNKIFWGDNLQVMSHLLKDYRGKINLIYIDPPFDSKADYKKKITLKGIDTAESNSSAFEAKQYGDIWTNDEYLQFMYERLLLMRELLSETGSIYVHVDENKDSFVRLLLDEIFGPQNFRREIIWRIGWISGYKAAAKQWIRNHDVILYYTKSSRYTFNKKYIPYPPRYKRRGGNKPSGHGYPIEDTWNCSELDSLNSIQIMSFSGEKLGYPTQKNENLLTRIIAASSNPGDIVFDCFMGSGTTQAAAMKLGRRFLGADINPGAIQTTTKRLLNVVENLSREIQDSEKYTGFEVYNVNNYDFFRDTVEARELLIKTLEIQKFPRGSKVDIEIRDILRDRADIQHDSEVEIIREGGKLIIRAFYPTNLLQKLSLQKEYVKDWRQLADSVVIDWNYDGAVMRPAVADMPGKNELVSGIYDIPEDSGTIRVKITDLLSESLEIELK